MTKRACLSCFSSYCAAFLRAYSGRPNENRRAALHGLPLTVRSLLVHLAFRIGRRSSGGLFAFYALSKS